jgi:hypothetical protein
MKLEIGDVIQLKSARYWAECGCGCEPKRIVKVVAVTPPRRKGDCGDYRLRYPCGNEIHVVGGDALRVAKHSRYATGEQQDAYALYIVAGR